MDAEGQTINADELRTLLGIKGEVKKWGDVDLFTCEDFLVCFSGESWKSERLFDSPALPREITYDSLMSGENVVRCPDSDFVYFNRILSRFYPLQVSFSPANHKLVHFDSDIVVPMLAEFNKDDFKVWMSHTPAEIATQSPGLELASGRCVVGGLGLGWFLNEVAKREQVTELILVEKDAKLLNWLKDAILAKYPAVREKQCQFVNRDVYDFIRQDIEKGKDKETKYLLDIWPNLGDADYDEQLHALEPILRKNVWSWGRFAIKPRISYTTDRVSCEKVYSMQKPCSGCPFSRAGKPREDDGGDATDPMRLAAQAQGPFILPCHQDPNYATFVKRGRSSELRQCAGAAIYRSNLGIAKKFPAVFHILPQDTSAVFASPPELIAHYNNITLAEAEKITTPEVVDACTKKEIQRVRLGDVNE
jgi:hypothetical protein